MRGLLQKLLDVPPGLVLAVVGLVVFAEDALFVGFVLPGETVAVLGGVAARLGHVPLAAVVVTVVAPPFSATRWGTKSAGTTAPASCGCASSTGGGRSWTGRRPSSLAAAVRLSSSAAGSPSSGP